MDLIFSFYESLHRKAPGSEASTRKALSLLAELPPAPGIVEFGCGSGAAARSIRVGQAEATKFTRFLSRMVSTHLRRSSRTAEAPGIARITISDFARSVPCDRVWITR